VPLMEVVVVLMVVGVLLKVFGHWHYLTHFRTS
jgi:hypothetical protein